MFNKEQMPNSSKLSTDTVKLATDTLKALIDTAVENNIPPSVFCEYVEFFGATLLLVSKGVAQKYASENTSTDKDSTTGYTSFNLEDLNA